VGVAILPTGARAAPPRAVDPFFIQREATAPPTIRAKLAQDRQKIQTNHLGYAVAYTTAMDRAPSALRGSVERPDLAQQMAAQAPKAAAWLQATDAKRGQAHKALPQWPTPTATRADLRPFLKGNYTYYPSLSQHMPVPAGTSPVPPIKDQNNCGGCFSFAPTTALEWSLLVWQDAFGQTGSQSEVVSPQSVLSCAGAGVPVGDKMDECTNGGYADGVLRWMNDVGAQKESEYAFEEADVCCGPPNNGFSNPSWCSPAQTSSAYCRDVSACKQHYAPNEKASGWGYLSAPGAIPTTAQMKEWISKYGALVVTVNAGAWSDYGGGVFSDSLPYSAGTDHVVVVIGWDDAAPTANGSTAGAWIVQNSWGTGWGDTCGFGTTKGYIYVQYGSSNIGRLTLWVST
jgi:cathepsin L